MKKYVYDYKIKKKDLAEARTRNENCDKVYLYWNRHKCRYPNTNIK